MKAYKFCLFFVVCQRVFTSDLSRVENAHSFAKGQVAFEKGRFREAVKQIDHELSQLSRDTAKKKICNLLLLKAECYQHLGFQTLVLNTLEEAKSLGTQIGNGSEEVISLLRMSDYHLSVGQLALSEEFVHQALTTARQLGDPGVVSLGLNALGNTQFANLNYRQAIAAYQESLDWQSHLRNPRFRSQILLNLANAGIEARKFNLVYSSLISAYDIAAKLNDDYQTGSLMLAIGLTAYRLQNSEDYHVTDKDLLKLSWQSFTRAEHIGLTIKNARLQSYGLGYLGALYQDEGRLPEAFSLTRRAIFLAQENNYPDLLYEWQWQLGRLLKRSGQRRQAMAMYEQAMTVLDPIRNELFIGYRGTSESFQTKVKPVYYELAELYVEEAEVESNPDIQQKMLKRARSTMERLKSAELEDYFKDECITNFQHKLKDLDTLAPGTAVVYPIPFPSRLVILVSLHGRIHKFSVNINSEKLNNVVRDFRRNLEIRTAAFYRESSEKLFDWLIQPLEPTLTSADVETLIFIPDGSLRLIPFSALHDGNQFAIEKFAFVTTPGLQLTDPKPITKDRIKTLIVGLSESVHGYGALPNVLQEIETIGDMLDGDIILNKDYTIETVSKKIRKTPYQILHMATHGEFGSDPQKTFLLTHNGKLSIDSLEAIIKLSRFRDEAIELLTLSACRTAAGDERAAFGLAGVAVKSGARSTLASLWYVQDDATSLMITDFYRLLISQPDLTKAQALRRAQLNLLSQRQYQHPCYWSSFLLIGNWL